VLESFKALTFAFSLNLENIKLLPLFDIQIDQHNNKNKETYNFLKKSA